MMGDPFIQLRALVIAVALIGKSYCFIAITRSSRRPFSFLSWERGENSRIIRCSSASNHIDVQHFQMLPLSIGLSGVSVEYQVSFVQRLFSSVPRRKFALNSIDLKLNQPQIMLLTGDSSAGKSTLLNVVAGLERPTHGCLEAIAGKEDTPIGRAMDLSPHALLLDAARDIPKYDYYSASTTTASDLVAKMLTKERRPTSSSETLKTWESLAEKLISIFVPNGENGAVVSSSQSQMYRTRLLEAAFESMVTNSACQNTTTYVPCPLILLDEWLDRETATVIQAVQTSLEELAVETGAIVLVVTHKPERWRIDNKITKRTALSLGRIVPNMLI